MAAEVDERSKKETEPSLRSLYRQAGLDRTRPSKRQTTKRSFKIVTNWNDGSSQTSVTSSQESPYSQQRTQRLSTIAASPNQDPADTSLAPSSPVIEPVAGSTSHWSHHSVVSPISSGVPPVVFSPRAASTDPLRLSLVTPSQATPDSSPSSIVLETQSDRQSPTDKQVQAHNEKTPSPSLDKSLSEKTPHSGPGALKITRGRKRRRTDADSTGNSKENEALEDEYRGNNFVRLFNADEGRKNSMAEITDLDVILTSLEEEALEVRDEIVSSSSRKAVKEFFIQMRKSFSQTIDISKENQMLKSDLRKAKSKVNKLRKELLSVQRKRSSTTAKLAKKQDGHNGNKERQKALEDFSSFLMQLEVLQKECRETIS